VPPLPPAFIAPADAVDEAASSEQVFALAAAGPYKHSEKAWELYQMLKDLRRQGYTCPGGQSFQANYGEFLFDCRLWKAAQLHSQDMGDRNYFSHMTPEGRGPYERSSAQGFATGNENIAAGFSDAAATMSQWRNSDGHCTNMMAARHTRVGVGYADVGSSTYGSYWTLLLASGGGPANTNCYLSGGGPGGGPGGGAGGGAGNGCVDKMPMCASWRAAGHCQTGSPHYLYVKNMCPKSCGFCGGGGSGGGPVKCEDMSVVCLAYKIAGFCEDRSKHREWMLRDCRKTCGLC